ncbi:MAG: response regulator transcription factor [Nibricoccus sp.]
MTLTPSTKILLVDDHVLVRHGIRLILQNEPGFEVVGEATDENEALKKAVELLPDVIVMDLDLAGINGLNVSRQILDAQPKTKIVVLSAESSAETAQRALQAGVLGYVIKGSSNEELVRAIHTVASGRCYLCPEITTALIRTQTLKPTSTDTPPLLTDRDRELMRLVAAGLRNKEIAEKFSLSIKAIEATRSKLMHKLGCNSAAELVRYAVREGIAKL